MPEAAKPLFDEALLTEIREAVLNYEVDLKDIQAIQPIQAIMAETLVNMLVPRQVTFSLIDILFKDMKSDYDELIEKGAASESEEEEKKPDSESDLSEAKSLLEMDEEPEEEDEEESLVIERKGILTIERIKDIVGEIMNTSKDTQEFDIIQYIIVGKVFEKKVLRESFLQEILNAVINASYANAMEVFINKEIFHKDKKEGQRKNLRINQQSDEIERVMEFSKVDINRTLIGWEDLIEVVNVDDESKPKEKTNKGE